MRRRAFVGTVALAALAFLAGLSPPTVAGRSWKARFVPRAGSVERLALTTDVDVSAKLPLIGGPEAQLSLRVETTRRIADRRRRQPATVELTIDRIAFAFELQGETTRYDSAVAGGGPPSIVGRYAGLLLGRTLVLRVLRTGEITEVRGLEGLGDELAALSGEGSAVAGVLESLTDELGATALRAVLQQATPVFPGGRLRVGDAWSREADLKHPLFAAMHVATGYRLEESARHAERKAARTSVALTLTPEGQGPLLDQLRRLAGIEGEVRLTGGEATGTATIWSDRRTGVTLDLRMEQRVRATLSVPVSILGFTRRTDVPLKLDQTITVERLGVKSWHRTSTPQSGVR